VIQGDRMTVGVVGWLVLVCWLAWCGWAGVVIVGVEAGEAWGGGPFLGRYLRHVYGVITG